MSRIKKRSPHLSYELNLAAEFARSFVDRCTFYLKPPSIEVVKCEYYSWRRLFVAELQKTKAPARVKADALIYFDDQLAKCIEHQTALFLIWTLGNQKPLVTFETLNDER